MLIADKIIYAKSYMASYLDSDTPNMPYVSMGMLLGHMVRATPCTAVDRTNSLVNRFNFEVLDPIPSIPSQFNKTFKDICYERAQSLIDQNKPISVMWSGGIDSTCALVALMELAPQGQVRVIFEDHAIPEYPWFFYEHIHGKIDYEILTKYVWRYQLKPDEIVVTGGLGDQLFSMSAVSDNFDFAFRPWQTIFDSDELMNLQIYNKQHVRNYFNKQSIRNYMRDHVQVLLNKAPFEIKTIFDFYWWINFSLKWQSITIRPMALKPITKSIRDRICGFFNSPNFQIWSMINHDLKVKDTVASYKYIMKDMIYDFTGDADYRDHKLKELSASRKKSKDKEIDPNPPVIVDTNFTNFNKEELLKNPSIFKSIATPIPDALLNNEVLYDDNWINWKDAS